MVAAAVIQSAQASFAPSRSQMRRLQRVHTLRCLKCALTTTAIYKQQQQQRLPLRQAILAADLEAFRSQLFNTSQAEEWSPLEPAQQLWQPLPAMPTIEVQEATWQRAQNRFLTEQQSKADTSSSQKPQLLPSSSAVQLQHSVAQRAPWTAVVGQRSPKAPQPANSKQPAADGQSKQTFLYMQLKDLTALCAASCSHKGSYGASVLERLRCTLDKSRSHGHSMSDREAGILSLLRRLALRAPGCRVSANPEPLPGTALVDSEDRGSDSPEVGEGRAEASSRLALASCCEPSQREEVRRR